jgi:hypothetical protein
MSFQEGHRIADAYRDMDRVSESFRGRALLVELVLNGTCIALAAPYLKLVKNVPEDVEVSLAILAFVLTFMQLWKGVLYLNALRKTY